MLRGICQTDCTGSNDYKICKLFVSVKISNRTGCPLWKQSNQTGACREDQIQPHFNRILFWHSDPLIYII